MKLIIGLGNPEKNYDGTRHNIGFSILDQYATTNGAVFQAKDKFKSKIAEITKDDKKVLLVKPMTYYNLVGEAAKSIVDFYKISPEDTLVIHDDLALPLGTIRAREGGSDAGNNGIKSINQSLGSDTCRLRIGTHHEAREQISDSSFVLSKFTPSEQKIFRELTPKINTFIDEFIDDIFSPSTHRESESQP